MVRFHWTWHNDIFNTLALRERQFAKNPLLPSCAEEIISTQFPERSLKPSSELHLFTYWFPVDSVSFRLPHGRPPSRVFCFLSLCLLFLGLPLLRLLGEITTLLGSTTRPFSNRPTVGPFPHPVHQTSKSSSGSSVFTSGSVDSTQVKPVTENTNALENGLP